MKIDVDIKSPRVILDRILDDEAGRFMAETCGNLFKKYVPFDTGTLSQSYQTEPWKVIYTQRYSHYQWQGVSKKGTPLNYSKEKNFLAQGHWEDAAFRDNANEIAGSLTEFLRRR